MPRIAAKCVAPQYLQIFLDSICPTVMNELNELNKSKALVSLSASNLPIDFIHEAIINLIDRLKLPILSHNPSILQQNVDMSISSAVIAWLSGRFSVLLP